MVKRYEVLFLPAAVRDLKRIDKRAAQRIIRKVRWLADNFNTILPEPLSGEFRGAYKLRVGDWRVIYTVSHREKSLTIHIIGHRRQIYER